MSLSPKEQEELKLLLEWQAWRNNRSQWIDECCLTRDEADGGKTKPFPHKDYLHMLDRAYETYPILAVPKSRRMIVTWRILANLLYDAMFCQNLSIFVQSKKAADSAYLLGDERLCFMYSNLWHVDNPAKDHAWPQIARRIKDSDGKGYDMIQFSNGVSLTAIAEGPDQLRQYTASRVYCTEMAFWGTAELTWKALRPTIQGGGKIIIDSSANPGFFQTLVEGDL